MITAASFEIGKRYLVRWPDGFIEGVAEEVDSRCVTIRRDGSMLGARIYFAGVEDTAQLVPDPAVQLAGALVADAIMAAASRYVEAVDRDGTIEPGGHGPALVRLLVELAGIAVAIRPPASPAPEFPNL